LGYVIPLSSFTAPCERVWHNGSIQSHPVDNSGCPHLCIPGPHKPDPSETWIALVQRGRCEFVSKVREAQGLGARAVVVGGVDPDVSGLPDTLINMYSPSDASDIEIPSTFITYDAYSQLSTLIASSNTSHSGLATLSLLITAEYSAWEWYSPIVTFVVILLLPSALTFLTLMIHRVRAARAAQRDRAPEDVVHRLPWRVWTGWEKDLEAADQHGPPKTNSSASPAVILAPSMNMESEIPRTDQAGTEGQPSTSDATIPHPAPWYATHQSECAICLCEFEKGDKVRVLPCLHIFHMEEVDEWLIKRKKLCPVCKRDVTEGEEAQTAEDTDEITPPPDERTPLLPTTQPSSR